MTLLIKPARRLSELIIDTDKDWQAFGITDVKELDVSMARGNMLFSDGSKLQKIVPGSVGTMLTTHGVGNNPTWGYGPHPP